MLPKLHATVSQVTILHRLEVVHVGIGIFGLLPHSSFAWVSSNKRGKFTKFDPVRRYDMWNIKINETKYTKIYHLKLFFLIIKMN